MGSIWAAMTAVALGVLVSLVVVIDWQTFKATGPAGTSLELVRRQAVEQAIEAVEKLPPTRLSKTRAEAPQLMSRLAAAHSQRERSRLCATSLREARSVRRSDVGALSG